MTNKSFRNSGCLETALEEIINLSVYYDRAEDDDYSQGYEDALLKCQRLCEAALSEYDEEED